MATICAPILKNTSSGTYWVIEEWLVTWLILMCCPSFGFDAGSNFSSNFVETREMLDPELIIIDAVGPLIELSRTVVLEGCAPRKVVPGGLPVTGLSCTTSELKALMLVDPNPLAPHSVEDNRSVSFSESWDSRTNSIWVTAQFSHNWYGCLEWLWRRTLMIPL